MTSRCIFVALLLLSIACRREVAEAPAQQATTTNTTTVADPPKDLSGQKVEMTVPVVAPVSDCVVKSPLTAGEQADFTMHLAEAPEKLRVGVRILRGEEEVTIVSAPAEGKKVVTLRLPELKAGKYKLVGLWGGNVGCEREIEVKAK
jgi:hypothetical protein